MRRWDAQVQRFGMQPNEYFRAAAAVDFGDTMNVFKDASTFPAVLDGPEREEWLHRITARDRLVRAYSWAIPTTEAVNAIASHSPIVEMGAGTGYWCRLLAEAGATVRAYDKKPPHRKHNLWRHTDTWWPVLPGTPRKLRKFSDHALFVCWPGFGGTMLAECLNAYEGETVIYIGEHGDCCEWDERLDHEFELVRELAIPQWWGIHDWLSVRKRKIDGR